MVVASLKSLLQRGHVMHAAIVSLLTFTTWFDISPIPPSTLKLHPRAHLVHVSIKDNKHMKFTSILLSPPALNPKYQTKNKTLQITTPKNTTTNRKEKAKKTQKIKTITSSLAHTPTKRKISHGNHGLGA